MSVHPISQARDDNDPRPALQRVCAGQPLLLTDDEVDLIDMVNRADDLIDTLLDLDGDPDDYRLAEVLIEFLCRRYGVERHADGDRVTSVQSVVRRHLIPFLVETDATRPEGRRGVGALRVTHLERLPRVLSGDLPMPAATVAGDQLRRRGAACIYLSLADAAQVTHGGAEVLTAALQDGTITRHTDIRTGESIVMALDLRRAGILEEPTTPHGIRETTAGNVLRDLKLAIERARGHGAAIRGTFQLSAITPLPANLARQSKPKARAVNLSDTATLAGRLSVVAQVVLWMGRLVGTRIGEIYGLLVCDYFRDEDGRPWLDFSKQGGLACLVRDPVTGRLVPQSRKPRTKTEKGERCIPIPRPLGDLLDRLIEAFHTDPRTGLVDYTARLVPGIGKDDASGQSTFRHHLEQAATALDLRVTPHTLRACLITDLRDAGIDERVRHFYVGHEQEKPTIQDRHYDLGVASELLFEVTDLLEADIAAQLGSDDLRVPTSVTHQWGTQTAIHARWPEIEETLRTTGWAQEPTGAEGQGRELSSAEVAQRIRKHPTKARELMRSGVIRSHQTAWKSRQVWVAYEADVDVYLASIAGTTIDELAEDLGWSYHQVRGALLELELWPADHVKGRPVRLDGDAAAALRAEATRRRTLSAQVMSLADAADDLGLPVTSVETLVRQGVLKIADGPTAARRRFVTTASVEAHKRRFPVQATTTTGAPTLTHAQTRATLGLTRPQVSALTSTRQLTLAKRAGSRHVYITVESALAYARRCNLHAAAAELEPLVASTSRLD